MFVCVVEAVLSMSMLATEFTRNSKGQTRNRSGGRTHVTLTMSADGIFQPAHTYNAVVHRFYVADPRG